MGLLIRDSLAYGFTLDHFTPVPLLLSPRTNPYIRTSGLADALMARSGSLASTVILLVIGSAVAGACTAKALAEIFPPGAQHVSATGR
jgi:hypothetical protein